MYSCNSFERKLWKIQLQLLLEEVCTLDLYELDSTGGLFDRYLLLCNTCHHLWEEDTGQILEIILCEVAL
jgi:hypothetical protein